MAITRKKDESEMRIKYKLRGQQFLRKWKSL